MLGVVRCPHRWPHPTLMSVTGWVTLPSGSLCLTGDVNECVTETSLQNNRTGAAISPEGPPIIPTGGNTASAPTPRPHVDAQCECTKHTTGSGCRRAEKGRESREPRRAVGGRRRDGRTSTQKLSELRQKNRRGTKKKTKKKLDPICRTFGDLSGGVRVADCLRTTAFPCGKISPRFLDRIEAHHGSAGSSSSEKRVYCGDVCEAAGWRRIGGDRKSVV